jgi:hypothetical protein
MVPPAKVSHFRGVPNALTVFLQKKKPSPPKVKKLAFVFKEACEHCTKCNLVCNKKKDHGPRCYHCGLLKVQCSHVTSGRGGSGSKEEDLVATMEDIRDNNKMWINMWVAELAWRADMEEQMARLLEEQCTATSLMHQQLYLMWDGYYNNEEFANVENWADLGERVVHRMFREAKEEQEAERRKMEEMD